MEIKSGQELYLAGVARREREECAVPLYPGQPSKVNAAREDATRGYAVGYGDRISKALREGERSGRVASFLEFYDGPLSTEVLGRLVKSGTPTPETT
jgi:hypothetical protein